MCILYHLNTMCLVQFAPSAFRSRTPGYWHRVEDRLFCTSSFWFAETLVLFTARPGINLFRFRPLAQVGGAELVRRANGERELNKKQLNCRNWTPRRDLSE